MNEPVPMPDPNAVAEVLAPGEDALDASSLMERYNLSATKPAEAPIEETPKEEKPVDEAPKEEEKPKLEIPEDFPHPEKATEKSVARWNDLKKAAEELQELKEKQLPLKEKELQERMREIEEARQKLAEFEGKDLSQYEKKIKELEERDAENEKFRSIHDVVNSKAFQEEVIRPSEEIGSAVEELAQSYDLSPDTLKEAMKIEDPIELRKRLRDLTFEWNPMDAAELAGHAKRLREIVSKSQSMIDNAENAKKELKFIEETEAKKRAEAEEIASKAATEAVEKQINEKFAFLKEHPDVIEAMKTSKFEDTPANRALAARLAPLVTKLNDLYMAEKQRVTELQAEMAKRNSAKPNPSTTISQSLKEQQQDSGGFEYEDLMRRYRSSQE